ncbi:MAG TPA: winged helix-turn-helix domain-containing protein [Candidatus Nanoarchaeia archaeon]|nr:winged helix-turn-helix domain-containing protein [Candidatus Nanoarchaeia archaeon]
MPPIDRITIINAHPPKLTDVNTELQWLGSTLGLFGERDKDSSCFRIFVAVFNASNKNEAVSSNDIADSCELARGTVIHHLNKLQDAGLVVHRNTRYYLSGKSMEDSVLHLQNEVSRMFTLLESVARNIDRKMGK